MRGRELRRPQGVRVQRDERGLDAGVRQDRHRRRARAPTRPSAPPHAVRRAQAKNGGHPSWVTVDGVDVTDDSKGTAAWGKSVLAAICAAAKKKGLKAAACA